MATSTIQATNGIIDIKNQITLTGGTNCGSVTLMEAYRSGNIVFLKFIVTPSTNVSSGGNVDVTLSGITPVCESDNRIGYGVIGTVLWGCWLTTATNIRSRKMASDTWNTSLSPIISGWLLVK